MRGGLENAFDPEEHEQDQKNKHKTSQHTIEQRAREAGL